MANRRRGRGRTIECDPSRAVRDTPQNPDQPAILMRSTDLLQGQVAHRYQEPGQEHVGDQAADDGDRQRLLHLGTGPQAHGQRDQPQDRAEAGHQDRPEPGAAGLQEGLVQRHPEGAELADVFDQDDAVLDVQADQQDHTHE